VLAVIYCKTILREFLSFLDNCNDGGKQEKRNKGWGERGHGKEAGEGG
jgi:hypothetical protein